MKHYLTSSLGRLRLLSYAEGTSLLLLAGIAVPLKHFGNTPLAVQLLGPVHGALFVLFVINAIGVGIERQWQFTGFTGKLLLACFIPFGTFYMDKRYLSKLPL
ncbi:integral membrane protein [Filimonas zeae]|uniref:Membrane protein n=1 Tax=Filimonas zeae TaxID=1737353 RepID=A0A917MX46_9BACT|nr:DUF3817 domain-containing protein [Filimonas zeae]MDR6340610.1 integral membrane protein [Filimonas zeae]GGH73540.1 membrane protein [Filimonas zeae]